MSQPVAVEATIGSRYDLQCRVLRNRGKANQMVYTLDTLSIDTNSTPRRGSDLEVIAWLRLTETGLGVENAEGEATIFLGGVETFESPYVIGRDGAKGDGWLRGTIPGGDLACRGNYALVLVATAPDGGQAATTVRFTLE